MLTLAREARPLEAEEEVVVEDVVVVWPLSREVDEARDSDDPAPRFRCEEPLAAVLVVVGMLEEDVLALSLGRSTVSRTVRISVLILNFDFWLKMLMVSGFFSALRSVGRSVVSFRFLRGWPGFEFALTNTVWCLLITENRDRERQEEDGDDDV